MCACVCVRERERERHGERERSRDRKREKYYTYIPFPKHETDGRNYDQSTDLHLRNTACSHLNCMDLKFVN